MKLTKEMFDFEKYEYSFGEISADKEYINTVIGAWTLAYPSGESGRLRIMRALKPPPRYILLNEGEALQAKDQRLLLDYPRKWASPLVDDGLEYGQVLPGEVWRRKDISK